MKIDENKKLIAQIFGIVGISFVLITTTQCGKVLGGNEVGVSVENSNDEAGNKGIENENAVESYFDDGVFNEVEVEEEKAKDKKNFKDVKTKEINVDNTVELQDYFDDDVDFSDVEEAISLNDSLAEKDRKILLNLVRMLEKKAPTIDLRCLYENCKLLKVIRESEYTNDKIAAVFDKDQHEFHIIEEDMDYHKINHEILRMINNLSLELEDGNILLKRDFRNKDHSTFLLEGFTEWFNIYLFGYQKTPYAIQVADVSMIQYMLDLNDDEFIQSFVNENASSITNLLEEYLTQEEISKFMGIGQKEYEKKTITKKEMSRKYSILLKGLLESRGNSISSDEMYQMWSMLVQSYGDYSNTYPEEISIMNEEFLSILRSSLDYTENDIVLLDNEKKEIKYCNINQMSMIELENGNIYIGEEYLDENKDRCYYLGDAIYQAKDEDIITPIPVLLNQEDERRKSYTTSDLAMMYFEYMGYDQGEKQAVKK